MHDVLKALSAETGQVAIEPPGTGDGFWAGGPSAVYQDGVWWLAYRLRRPVDQGRGYANVVARSSDGVSFETVATVTSVQMGAASLERPALVARPEGGWRLYVSCSTLGSKHWWVEALDADEPAGLAAGERTVVLPGGPDVAWKDVVVVPSAAGWLMWACRHPLDGGDDEADRMTTWLWRSQDGLHWVDGAPCLVPGTGWDSRGARVSAVLPGEGDRWWALYDGRASAAENWFERTGLAEGTADALTAVDGPVPAEPGRALRYASVAADEGGLRAFYERTRPDGAHDLRSVYVPRPVGDSQSE